MNYNAFDIILLNMPFSPIQRPSLALGALSAVLRSYNFKVMEKYANLLLLKILKPEDYLLIQKSASVYGMADWVFTNFAFPEIKNDDNKYIENLIKEMQSSRRVDPDFLRTRLLFIKESSKKFLNELVSEMIEAGPSIVGCTSTFQQHISSLAILRILREKAPDIITIMGGANCETVMGAATHKNFKFVDYVVSGEADELIGPLIKSILDNGRDIPPEDVPYGVFAPCHRTRGYPNVGEGESINYDQYPRATVASLDNIPIPDYDEYFETLRSITGLKERIVPCLPVETSRSCFWGKCHFCGLNGKTNGQRIKKVNKVLEEINTLSCRYGIDRIEAVDNVLHPKHVPELFEKLVSQGSMYRIFYEVRTFLKKMDIEIMSNAGVNWIQPGIESLHEDILCLMNKGVEVWQNIQVLKWCREYGIRAVWKIMFGFPAEKDIWYNEMAEMMPLLFHLEPPNAINQVRFDRYSEYYKNADKYNLHLNPFELIACNYNLKPDKLKDLLYFFEDAKDRKCNQNIVTSCILGTNSRAGLLNVKRVIKQWALYFWNKKYRRPLLLIIKKRPFVKIIDTRPVALSPFFELNELQSAIYLACDEARKIDKLRDDFKKKGIIYKIFDRACENLINQKLMLLSKGHILSLALSSQKLPLSKDADFPLGMILNDIKERQ